MPVQRSTTISARAHLFRDAVSFVEANHAMELTLSGVARAVASSPRQLQRVYAEVGQTTFREHLTRVRMKRAAVMLTDGHRTVGEVARMVGYRQPAQFAKAFCRQTGMNPSAYRSRLRLSASAEAPQSP